MTTSLPPSRSRSWLRRGKRSNCAAKAPRVPQPLRRFATAGRFLVRLSVGRAQQILHGSAAGASERLGEQCKESCENQKLEAGPPWMASKISAGLSRLPREFILSKISRRVPSFASSMIMAGMESLLSLAATSWMFSAAFDTSGLFLNHSSARAKSKRSGSGITDEPSFRFNRTTFFALRE